jgi:hypothetical protein
VVTVQVQVRGGDVAGCAAWQSINPLCRVSQAVGGVSKAVAGDVFGSIANYFAGLANAAVSWLWDQLDAATSVDVASAGIRRDLIATGSIAALITVTLFLVQVIASILRQRPGGLGRAVRGLGISFVGAAFAVATTQILLGAVDAVATGVVHYALGTDVKGLGSKLIVASTMNAITNPAALLLMSLILIAAVIVIWVALMVRKMLIITSAVFAPIAFAGATSDISSSWVRRWIEFTVALVISKLILVMVFMIGLSVLEGGGETPGGPTSHATQSITNLAVGALTLLLAGFAPWIAIKTVHFAGESFHAVHAQGAAAAAGAQIVIAAPRKFSSAAGGVGLTGTSADAGLAGAGGANTSAQARFPRPPVAPAFAAGPLEGPAARSDRDSDDISWPTSRTQGSDDDD